MIFQFGVVKQVTSWSTVLKSGSKEGSEEFNEQSWEREERCQIVLLPPENQSLVTTTPILVEWYMIVAAARPA